MECVFTSKVSIEITNTNVFLNHYAICPWTLKIGLINCFLNRAFNVCSNWSLFHQEISISKTYFIKIDSHIEFFIIVSKNFSTINLIQKQMIKTAKMKTIDA